METIKLLIGPFVAVLSGIVSHVLSVNAAVSKSTQNQAVQAAVLEQRISDMERELGEHKETTQLALTQIAGDFKAATKELNSAAASIRALSETQAVINTMTSKTLEALVDKLEKLNSMHYELKGRVARAGA